MTPLEERGRTAASLRARHAFVERVEDIAGPAIALLEEITAIPGEAPRVAVSLVCTQVELFAAVAAVLKSDGGHHAMTLIRSMLEAQANLYSVVADPEHVKRMRMESANNLVEVFGGFMADPDTREGIDSQDIRNTVRIAGENLARLKAEGFRIERAKEKFRRAGLEGTYKSFQLFCSSAHNDLNALSVRHLRDGDVLLFEPMTDIAFQGACGISLAALFQSIRRLPEVSTADASELDRVLSAQEILWIQAQSLAPSNVGS